MAEEARTPRSPADGEEKVREDRIDDSRGRSGQDPGEGGLRGDRPADGGREGGRGGRDDDRRVRSRYDDDDRRARGRYDDDRRARGRYDDDDRRVRGRYGDDDRRARGRYDDDRRVRGRYEGERNGGGGGRPPYAVSPPRGGARRRAASPPPSPATASRRRAEREEEEREKELAELERDLRTVFAYNLPLRASERDLFDVFRQVGPLADIRIIRDRGSRLSKGVAYIEMQKKEDAFRAIGLTGTLIMGQALVVKASEAEKNLQWEAQEAQKAAEKGAKAEGASVGGAAGEPAVAPPSAAVTGGPSGLLPEAPALPPPPPPAVGDLLQQMTGGAMGAGGVPGGLAAPPTGAGAVPIPASLDAASSGGIPPAPTGAALPRGAANLGVSNLHPSLVATDLAPVFEPFGELLGVTVGLGAATGTALITYHRASDAAAAAQALEGLDLLGARLVVRVTELGTGAPPGAPPAAQPPGLAAAALPPPVESVPERLDGGGASDGGGMRLDAAGRAALMSRLAATAGISMPQSGGVGAALGAGAGPGGAGAGQRAPLPPPDLALDRGLLGPASPIPTRYLMLKNLFDPREETEEGWREDIGADVRDECEKLGEVTHVWVDPEAPGGHVYIRMSSVDGAKRAREALHGRWFAARQVAVDFQFEKEYRRHFQLGS